MALGVVAEVTVATALNCSLRRRLGQPFGRTLRAVAHLGLELFWSAGLGLAVCGLVVRRRLRLLAAAVPTSLVVPVVGRRLMIVLVASVPYTHVNAAILLRCRDAIRHDQRFRNVQPSQLRQRRRHVGGLLYVYRFRLPGLAWQLSWALSPPIFKPDFAISTTHGGDPRRHISQDCGHEFTRGKMWRVARVHGRPDESIVTTFCRIYPKIDGRKAPFPRVCCKKTTTADKGLNVHVSRLVEGVAYGPYSLSARANRSGSRFYLSWRSSQPRGSGP